MCSKYEKLFVFSILLLIIALSFSCNKNPTTPSIQDMTKPVIWLDVFNISFVASETGPNPLAQTLKLKNTGQGALNYSISDDADWLTVSETSSTSTGQIKEHTVSVNKNSLTPKEEAYTAVITVSSSGAYNSPQKVNVRLTLSGESPPEIQVTPTNLSFHAQSGGADPAQKKISILNTGSGTLQFTVEPDASWISVNPSSGTSKDQQKKVSVSVQIAGLATGTYNGNILISDLDTTKNPQEVNISLTISEAGEAHPEIQVTPTNLNFNAQSGGADPAQKEIYILNTGSDTLQFSVEPDASWISVNPSSGTSKGQQKKVRVSVQTAGMATGTYNGNILVSDPNATNSPQEVNISFTISEVGEAYPEIQVTPTNLRFNAQSGGADPAQKEISILNTGSDTLQFSVKPNASWISVNPSSGTSKDQQKKVSVSVQIAGLATGTYNGKILVSDPDATNSPQEVNISLIISEVEEAHPEIQVTPTNLSFNAQSGGADPAQKEIYILNTGSSTLQFSVKPDVSWISVNPSSDTSKDQQKKVSVSVQIAGLATGTYNGNILVSDPNATNSPQKVKVNLTISEKSTPEIAINPKNITFQASQGDSNPSPAYMYVSNSGESTLNYSIDWNTNWLSVSPNTGQTEAAARKHTISANISGLSAGSYSATITVTDPEASNSPQTVNVTLTITASSVPTDNKVGISLSPSSGPTGTTVTIPISVKGNTSQISTFGIEMHFDTTMFAFQSVTSGTLTVSWGYMGGNDTGGTIIIGGARLAANPISIGSSGTIAIVKLKVTCSSCSNGNTSQITINNLSDDISGMTASPSSVTFTYTE